MKLTIICQDKLGTNAYGRNVEKRRGVVLCFTAIAAEFPDATGGFETFWEQPPYANRLALPATASASAGGGEAQQRAQVEVGGGATGEERFTTPWFCLEFNFLVEE